MHFFLMQKMMNAKDYECYRLTFDPTVEVAGVVGEFDAAAEPDVRLP